MATVAGSTQDIRKKLSSIIECSICTETLKDPRLLPCVHTYCMKCIRQFCHGKLSGDKVPCPVCRRNFVIPENGLEGLPRNFFIYELKDLADVTSQRLCDNCTESDNNRTPCRDESGNKLAVVRCTTCTKLLCSTCEQRHRSHKSTRSHQIVPVDVDSTDTDAGQTRAARCDKHADRRLELYCLECKMAICTGCFKSHNGHNCLEVNDLAGEFRRHMTADINSLGRTARACLDMLKRLARDSNEFNEKVDQVEKNIVDQVEQLQSLIDREKQQLMKELALIRARRLRSIDETVRAVHQHKLLVENLMKYTEELRDKGTSIDIARQMGSLHERAGELLMLDAVQTMIHELGSVGVKLSPPSKPPSEITGSNFIGCIREIKSIRPTITNVIPGDEMIRAVVSLADQLFVLRQPHRQQIELFHADTYASMQPLHIKGLGAVAGGMACSSVDGCLYVSDYTNSCVFKVELSGGVYKWRVGNSPAALSLNRSNNVLVTSSTGSKIYEYSARGILVRKIRLQLEVSSPLIHAIQSNIDEGTLVIIYGGPLPGILLVDVDGRTVAACTARELWATKIDLRQLAVGGSTKCLLVIDQLNNRIIGLNSTLSVARDLPITGTPRAPSAIHVDESRGRLYIGEQTGRVVVYSIDDIAVYIDDC